MPPRRRSKSPTETETIAKRRRYNFRNTSYRKKLRNKLKGELEGRKPPLVSDEEFREKDKLLKVSEKPGKALNLTNVVFPKSNLREHHTKEYEHSDIILRRGQPFMLSVAFDRNVTADHDDVTLQFTVGDRPLISKGTNIRIPLKLKAIHEATNTIDGWNVVIDSIEGATVRCIVSTPPDCSIGFYRLYVDAKIIGSEDEDSRVLSEFSEQRLIILFNPWCEGDVVYMEDVDQRFEYVRNETGNIWVGNRYFNKGKPWNFGQFDAPVLDVALSILETGGLTDVALSGPVSVVRCISALTNSMDDDGVLEGRWTKEYPKDCTLPWEWTGSVPILKEYYESGKPVRFGQCWVFSGIVTTLCRALGIPTRSVTNFDSAHDSDCSMTIDNHYDEEGEPLEDLNDSVWNFHVWNESWFRRLDLPDGYDGWQAHDATPQELSNGVMRCGPAPMTAIKEGHVYLNYDVGFIYAEVNGDKIKWQRKKDGTMEVMSIDKYSVGSKISTKSVGSDEREDLTHYYKYSDGSKEERTVAHFVNRFSTSRKQNIYKTGSQREFEISITTPEDTLIGDDFTVRVLTKNKTQKDVKARIKATVVNAFYTGVCGSRVMMNTTEDVVKANGGKEMEINVPLLNYEGRLNPHGQFRVFVTARNIESLKMEAHEANFSLQKPNIHIEMPETVYSRQETKVVIRFANTTRLTLTGAVISVEGSGLIKPQSIQIQEDIKPIHEVTETIIVHPKRRYRSRRTLVVTMKTDQIAEISGSKGVRIEKKTKDMRTDSDSDSDDDEEGATS